MNNSSNHPLKKIIINFIIWALILLPCLTFSQEKQKEDEKKTKSKKTLKITEEILVVAEAPRDLPISTVTRLDHTKIEHMKPLDLSEAIRYAPGVMVTFGDKSTYTLKLRGMDSKRIALLIDGIPVYEPYYSTFDLKTISTYGIDSLQLTKGPSSVLYGPNTLGGIVNVITRRPSVKPTLSFHTSYGEKNTLSLGLNSAFQLKRFAFAGNMLYQDSDGFYFPSQDEGNRIERSNTEYERLNLNTKIYYYPSSSTEILFNGGIYKSNYAMPPQLDAYKPRYWRFKNWNRHTLNAGGYTALGEKSTLRFRGYFVHYDNTLDQFEDSKMTHRRFESTFDNSVLGFFSLADIAMSPSNSLKFSINYKRDTARTQDDLGESWNKYNQDTFSAGIEDHISFFKRWKLVFGLSYDYLDKFIGKNASKVNPLIGLKYSPIEYIDLHLSFSKKSKFPSMRSMYSSSSGNPDLLSEYGSNCELGFTYNKIFLLTGSVFLTSFKDMIDSLRLPEYDFRRRYFNVAEAYINGFELQFQKAFPWLSTTINYTFLDHKNKSDDRPLDALPRHSLNFDFTIYPSQRFRIVIMGLVASSSSWLDYQSKELLDIPSYFNLDTIISYQFKRTELFIKITNVFDHYIYSEPGFPWRGRYIELGIKANILK